MTNRMLQAFWAGVAAAIAYLGAQELDRRLAEPRSNDLVLVGGLVSERPSAWRPLGLILHLLAGGVFGVVFERVVAPKLAGPYWLRGVMMAQLENLTLFPLLIPIDRTHPAIASGALAPTFTLAYFWQSVWRHLALGAVLGALLTPRTAAVQR